MELIIEWIVDESKWIFPSVLCALIAPVFVLARGRTRDGVLCAMFLYFGGLIGMLGSGHLIAVSVKSVRGTLDSPLLPLIAIGVVLLIPAILLIYHAARSDLSDARSRRRLFVLNVVLGAAVLVLGPVNAPLAIPSLLNAVYQLHSRRAIGRIVIGLWIATTGALLVGSLVFLASGQSFEQFGLNEYPSDP